MKYILNNQQIAGQFEHNGVKYPANWLALSSAEDRAALGIVDLPDDPPPDVPPYVPPVVTMRQARLALLGAGVLDQVDAAIAAIPDATQRKAAEITWEFSGEVQRHNGLVSQLGPALGLTEQQIDDLFVAAAAL